MYCVHLRRIKDYWVGYVMVCYDMVCYGVLITSMGLFGLMGVFHLLICILWIWVYCIWNKRIKWSMVPFVRFGRACFVKSR